MSKSRGAQSQVASPAIPIGAKLVLDEAGFASLISVLIKIGYQPIGPQVRDGAVVYGKIESPQELPIGVSDEQDGGSYRLAKGTAGAYFEYTVGATSWKSFLFPSKQKLWQADRKGDGFEVDTTKDEEPAYAFIGVRPCELAAMQIQDKVFGYNRSSNPDAGIFSDPNYVARRKKSLIVVVNCGRAGKTCFCCTVGGDPDVAKSQALMNKAKEGCCAEGSDCCCEASPAFDLALTELTSNGKHEFVIEAGSERGALILELLPRRAVTDTDIRATETSFARARSQMTRKMIPEVGKVLQRNLEHPRWDKVAERCLTCANCTMACPTCFCSTVEDTTDLSGDHAERWKLWDSCFSIDFSYIHGGSIRREGKSRYRQWMTHKLSNWHEQFGTSGCVGCGRCITWCPVGIDITEEARAIKNSEGIVR